MRNDIAKTIISNDQGGQQRGNKIEGRVRDSGLEKERRFGRA